MLVYGQSSGEAGVQVSADTFGGGGAVANGPNAALPPLKNVQRQQIEVKKQLDRAQARLAYLNDVFHGSGGGAGQTLILSSADTKPKEQAELQEDLAVMAHILDKAAAGDANDQSPAPRAAGINILFAPGSNQGNLNNLYLDGYGTLFMLRVNFPLLPPADETKTAKETPPTNSAWEEARREVYGPAGGEPTPVWTSDSPAEEYSEDKVNQLKAGLLDALKDASNIRHLKPEDWITVCVMGTANAKQVQNGVVAGGGASAGIATADPTGGQPVLQWKTVEFAPGGKTVMTLRVKKSDVDDYAKGDLDAAKFQKRVSITTYTSGEDQDSKRF